MGSSNKQNNSNLVARLEWSTKTKGGEAPLKLAESSPCIYINGFCYAEVIFITDSFGAIGLREPRLADYEEYIPLSELLERNGDNRLVMATEVPGHFLLHNQAEVEVNGNDGLGDWQGKLTIVAYNGTIEPVNAPVA